MTRSTVAVCCDDLGVMSDARRACAAAGLEVELVGDGDAHRWWPSATAVLVDVGAATQLCEQSLPRRPAVALLTRSEDSAAWRLAVSLGAEQVAVLPSDEGALLRGVLAARSSGGALVVAVLPATGGSGASTFAAALALASARSGAATLLVDADAAGGGLDLLLGVERAAGARWPDLETAGSRLADHPGLEALVQPTRGLRLLSWDRRATAAGPWASLWPVVAAARTDADLVVVDLPRRPETLRRGVANVALLVSRTGVRPAVAAAHAAASVRATVDDVRLVVRRAGRGSLAASDVATAAGLPLAAEIPECRRLVTAADDGQLPRMLARWPLQGLLASLLAAKGDER